jgi:hypothetical protein
MLHSIQSYFLNKKIIYYVTVTKYGWGQSCHIFLGATYQNGENIYQITFKYTKWPQNIPNGREMDQMDIK